MQPAAIEALERCPARARYAGPYVLAMAFLWFVWPTPYEYTRKYPEIIRVNRFTGVSARATDHGWRTDVEIAADEAKGEAREAKLQAKAEAEQKAQDEAQRASEAKAKEQAAQIAAEQKAQDAPRVEQILHAFAKIRSAKDTFVDLCRGRSVFTDEELADWWGRHPNYPPFVVNILYVHSFPPPRPTLRDMMATGILTGAPRGFERLSPAAFDKILELANADRRLIVD